MSEQEHEPVPDTQRVGENLDATIEMLRADRLRVAKRSLKLSRQRARRARGYDDRPVRAETQVLVNGTATTVTELAAAAKRQPSTHGSRVCGTAGTAGTVS